MNSRIQVEEDLMIVCMSGEIDLAEGLELFKSRFDSAMETGCRRILFDATEVRGELTTHERFILGEEMAKHEHLRGFHPRMALLGSLPTVDGFGVLVVQNRGVNAKAFSVKEEALGWLAG
jgi:hypothetical protein